TGCTSRMPSSTRQIEASPFRLCRARKMSEMTSLSCGARLSLATPRSMAGSRSARFWRYSSRPSRSVTVGYSSSLLSSMVISRRRPAVCLLAGLGPRIAKRHGAVEHRLPQLRIQAIGDEVAMALELETILGTGILERRFKLRLDHAHRIRIDVQQEVAVAGARIGHGEEAVVETDFAGIGVRCRNPVQIALDLVVVGAGRAGFRVRHVFAMHGDDITGVILVGADALDHEAVTQTHEVAREEAEVFLFRNLHIVFPLDPQFATERHFA